MCCVNSARKSSGGREVARDSARHWSGVSMELRRSCGKTLNRRSSPPLSRDSHQLLLIFPPGGGLDGNGCVRILVKKIRSVTLRSPPKEPARTLPPGSSAIPEIPPHRSCAGMRSRNHPRSRHSVPARPSPLRPVPLGLYRVPYNEQTPRHDRHLHVHHVSLLLIRLCIIP